MCLCRGTNFVQRDFLYSVLDIVFGKNVHGQANYFKSYVIKMDSNPEVLNNLV